MTENKVESQAPETKSDKDYNFRKVEAKSRELESQLMQERQARMEMEKKFQEMESRKPVEDDDDEEPYVAPKKLEKKLANFGKQTQTEIHKSMEQVKQQAKEEIKQEMWLESNPDFFDTLQHAEKLYERSPKLAENILRMPDTFERQKLVYYNIKELGLNKPPEKQSSIQDKIDANRRSPYYQPSNVAAAPYASAGDFSAAGQKNAYEKMQELKSRLRMG